MKNHSTLPIVFFTVVLFTFLFSTISCTSSKKRIVQEKSETFAGDYDPIELGKIMSVNSTFSGIKPREITAWFVPRSNNVELYFRDTINQAAIVLTYKDRVIINEAIQQYMSLYLDESNPMQDRAPSRKNGFIQGKATFSWGVLGLARSTDAEYSANYNFLEEGRPYFVLTFYSSPDKKEGDVYSSQVDLYFSPSQLEKVYDLIGDEALDSIITQKDTAAYTF